jgi:hypothetical protein
LVQPGRESAGRIVPCSRVLDVLFPSHGVSRHDAAQINDRLDPKIRPTVVLMNPPFSVSWKLRFFAPVGATGPEIFARLIERHPITAIVDRDAA